MATKQTTWDDWDGADVIGSDGEKIGSLGGVYNDADTGKPTWLGVKTGLLGMKETLVPTKGVSGNGDALQVAYTEAQVKDAPNVDPENGEVDRGDESGVYQHYGIASERGGGDSRSTDGSTARKGAGAKVDKGAGDAAMTRSEEEMQVGTRQAEAGKVRLKKHVVTENVTTTVPVRKEVARIEREPVNAGDGTATISDDEEEIVLSQEEVVTDKKVVEKERVRLAKDVETEEREVSGEVRKERIDVDEDGTGTR